MRVGEYEDSRKLTKDLWKAFEEELKDRGKTNTAEHRNDLLVEVMTTPYKVLNERLKKAWDLMFSPTEKDDE